MFRRLKEKIESALEALEGRSPGDPRQEVDRLLAGMREELIEARAALPGLEKQISDLRAIRARELREVESCIRRAEQARKIGDDETVEVAVRFAEKHRSRAEVAAQKLEAAEAELAMQERSVREMTDQLKSALARRDAIAAQARRADATDSLRGGRPSAVDDFDRIVEGIEDAEQRAAAARDVEEAFEDLEGGAGGELDPEELAELRLEELKRRMRDSDPEP
jgi:phage shock protein A